MKKLVGQIVGLFSATIKKREIDFKLSLPEEPVISLIDRNKFEKVLVNLISNAIKYSNVGDSLTVKMSVIQRDGKQWIKTDVADTGIGVPDDKREAIFRRFYQIEHKRSQPFLCRSGQWQPFRSQRLGTDDANCSLSSFQYSQQIQQLYKD